MGIVIFKGKKKGDEIEILEGSLGLEGKKRRPGTLKLQKVCPFGKERPFAHCLRKLIDNPINGLKTQVGHSHMVIVGKNQSKGELPPRGLNNRSLFLCQEGPGLLL